MRYIPEEVVRRTLKIKEPCCTSCHKEPEDIAMHEIELGKQRYSEVCCTIQIAFEEKSKPKKEGRG